MLSGPLFAEVSISGVDDISIDAWAGSTGDLVGTDTHCIRSCQGNCNSGNPRDYKVAAYTNGSTDGSGNFYLSHDSDGSADPMQVVFEWANPSAGNFTMTDFDTTGYQAPPNRAPGATTCGEAAAQNSISLRVPASELASATAGIYSETFALDVCSYFDFLWWEIEGDCTAEMDFLVEVPELIQITQLQDIDLGSWNATSDMQATRDFCVFRNGYGSFALTATGNNDSGGDFRVSSGANNIPYSLAFSQNAGWYAATPGNALGSNITGFTGESLRDCGGGSSHSLRVSVNETDLGTAQEGTYTDTVTVLVQPD